MTHDSIPNKIGFEQSSVPQVADGARRLAGSIGWALMGSVPPIEADPRTGTQAFSFEGSPPQRPYEAVSLAALGARAMVESLGQIDPAAASQRYVIESHMMPA
ncbi:MAG TPA: hypothetical protein VMY99_03950 [Nevskiaceae bacterium]|nr:hypothetical protein [Nevskiaceae bacterium]